MQADFSGAVGVSELLEAKGRQGGGHQQSPHHKDGVGVFKGQRDPVAITTAVVPVAQHLGNPAVHDAHLAQPHQPVLRKAPFTTAVITLPVGILFAQSVQNSALLKKEHQILFWV